MAVNIDLSRIEDSTRSRAPRTQPAPAGDSLDDAFIDVTTESEIAPAVPVVPHPAAAISHLDQLSLLCVILMLCAALALGQFVGESPTAQPPQLGAYRIDLNSAGIEELVLLEGIGEVTAEKIILDRERNGPFLTKDDLQRVKGIGPKTMERLRDYVVCR